MEWRISRHFEQKQICIWVLVGPLILSGFSVNDVTERLVSHFTPARYAEVTFTLKVVVSFFYSVTISSNINMNMD